MMPLPRTLERSRKVPRGQPVIALATILTLWIALRVTFIGLEGDPVAAHVQQMARLPEAQPSPSLAVEEVAISGPYSPWMSFAAVAEPAMSGQSGVLAERRAAVAEVPQPLRHARGREAGIRNAASAGPIPLLPEGLAASYDLPEGNSTGFTGQRLSFFAPPPQADAPSGEEPLRPAEQRRPAHWSADGWLLMRSGDQLPGLAAGNASYGGSQAGAVLRYAFARASPLRPQAYARFSGSLGGKIRQSEVALGLMARPLRRIPLAILGEARMQQQPGQIRLRPVVMAITQLPPLRWPMGIEADAYAQGGWAGGRDATLFYDLAATFQHRVLRPLRGTQLSAGGGVWSGGQRGASRLDVGPRVELRGMVGPPSRRIGVRVGVDWRFRVAGKAEPGSGPALTVAAGF